MFFTHGVSGILCQAFDRVAEISRTTGRPMPKHLVVQADNTVAQNKNSVAGMFLAWLVAMGKFLTCTMNFLIVGHAHEDVDRLFALILARVLQRCSWQTPEDLQQHLVDQLSEYVHKKKEEPDSVKRCSLDMGLA